MKIKDVAHNHSLTDLLKVSIFSLLMLAPMINVGVRSAYVICNKNAYQSYYGETINEIEYENNVTNILPTETYYFSSNNLANTTFGVTDVNVTNVSNFSSNATNTTTITENLSNINRLRWWIYGSGDTAIQVLWLYYTENDKYSVDLNNKYLNIQFEVNSINSYNTDINTYLYNLEYNKYSYLDNVFEYSVNQLTESPLYNWVENTAIYSGVALMNTQLGITQPVISLLVVYWLLLTIIYVIIDIVIRVFTWLTHMIGSKTA